MLSGKYHCCKEYQRSGADERASWNCSALRSDERFRGLRRRSGKSRGPAYRFAVGAARTVLYDRTAADCSGEQYARYGEQFHGADDISSLFIFTYRQAD